MKPISLYCRAEDSAGHTTDGQKTLKCCALILVLMCRGMFGVSSCLWVIGTGSLFNFTSAGEHGEMKK